MTARGLAYSAGKKSLRMNHAAWEELDRVEKKPEAYPETDEIFTADRTRIYGVLMHVDGKRYGPEFNGTRKAGWGEGQNRDFQNTAPYLALRSEKPLEEAIADGLARANRDPELKKAMGYGVPPEQMAFWMQDLTEITLLDFIFSQQDRIGNIDHVDFWHWSDNGEARQSRVTESSPPAEIASLNPILIKRTWLNDNDAGGKRRYANFTKKTGMLEKIRHYNPETWRRLMTLDREFRDQGPLHAYVRDTFGLTDTQFEQVVTNTHQAAEILRTTCKAGNLRFDLDPEAFLVKGEVEAQQVDCDNP